jgi:rhamnosyltransferase
MRWLPDQVKCILSQQAVDIRLIVSDDQSSDGTWEWLQELAIRDTRVTILPRNDKFGSAASNFYRLILDAETGDCDFVAFSDQDDIWETDKLARHADIATRGRFDGISSSVVAFWENGYSVQIDKAQPQRTFDFLFGSPGPGCTFLMTPWLIGQLRRLLIEPTSPAKDVALHDWLAYAVCRAAGRAWHIDDVPTVRYRQHQVNEFGANHGIKAAVSRMARMTDGWYRQEVIKIVMISSMLSSDQKYVHLLILLNHKAWIWRLGLLRYISGSRRRFVDRLVLAIAIVINVF